MSPPQGAEGGGISATGLIVAAGGRRLRNLPHGPPCRRKWRTELRCTERKRVGCASELFRSQAI